MCWGTKTRPNLFHLNIDHRIFDDCKFGPQEYHRALSGLYMLWKKLGKIFDPTDSALPQGCKEFAQSPQALVFDNFVRIYFSTRAVDPANGKFLSHVAFVDMRKDLRTVIGVSKHSPME